MRYFYDTEFIEDGRTIDLISIGIVAEDGREYYAVNSDMPVDRIERHVWLMFNVVPSLPVTNTTLRQIETRRKHGENVYPKPGMDLYLDTKSTLLRPHWLIANEVREFLLADDNPELWAWYAAYDHVALCQLWGSMVGLPDGLPMHTNDIKQECDRLGRPQLPEQPEGVHNALADARHNKVRFDYLLTSAPRLHRLA
jgi:hypothetical protein